MVILLPLESTLLEKSPPRSAVVGTVMLRTPCGRNWRWDSSLTKKNSVWRLFKILGMITGPPIGTHTSLSRNRARGLPPEPIGSRLLLQVLALRLSLRWKKYPVP